MVAANSVNYGRAFKLTCAEACAATLYICGKQDAARKVMEEFSYGPEFFKINREVLDLYASCQDAEEVVAKQNEWLELAQNRSSALGESQSRKHSRQSDYEDEDGNQAAWVREHGLPGELPPSDDEDDYYGYGTEEEAELLVDKFGNFISDPAPEPDYDDYGDYDSEEQEAPKLDKFGNFVVDDERMTTEDPKF
ncbi:unnamed protein product [Pseudo-nitzschia multistriata]|uniref:16S/18S rRNA aminocarboxypropyltransferase Tsr3 C-terminal domain-containing protein n=1 Tax=Pseudo-nitzschia multistriata TaxID=183589 RepID=A0A448Z4T4_9STRA|nr:unnamed protein product [Pseudo-nitzschia multistriata]